MNAEPSPYNGMSTAPRYVLISMLISLLTPSASRGNIIIALFVLANLVYLASLMRSIAPEYWPRLQEGYGLVIIAAVIIAAFVSLPTALTTLVWGVIAVGALGGLALVTEPYRASK